jgi:sugar/nucleoside kinase (ribokinase family)
MADISGVVGPDPRRIMDLAGMADELRLLQARAARGTGRSRVSLAELTRRVGLPASSKSTVHSYMSGRTLPPVDVLDKLVIALGATPDEQAQWAEAWFRLATQKQRLGQDRTLRGSAVTRSPAERIVDHLYRRLQRSERRPLDVLAVSAQNLDLIHRVNRIAPDHEESVGQPVESPGGSGANTALGIALAGGKVGVLGAVGNDDYGRMLRQHLEAAGVNTSFLLTIDAPGHKSGHTQVFTDRDGQRLIYVFPGVNEELAKSVRLRVPPPTLSRLLHDCKILHLSSFTSAAEREMQADLLARAAEDTIVSFSPGSLYSELGADRLGHLLARCNVLFLYEQHLELLLNRSSASTGATPGDLTSNMQRLYDWRRQRGSAEPLVLVVKRPSDLVRGRLQSYMAVGYGVQRLEEVGGPDAGDGRHDVLDSTGAGDALAAGFLLGLLNRRPPNECSNMAFVMALSASSQLGARVGLPVRERLAEQWRRYLFELSVPHWLELHAQTPGILCKLILCATVCPYGKGLHASISISRTVHGYQELSAPLESRLEPRRRAARPYFCASRPSRRLSASASAAMMAFRGSGRRIGDG